MNYMIKYSRHPHLAGLLVSIIVFLCIFGLRAFGVLESMELAAYDAFLRFRQAASDQDSRITLISVSEKDIQNQGRWPLSDATLARMLSILSECNPRAIGVDIYRDVPVPPGHEDLEAVLSKNRNIIAIMKFRGGRKGNIPAPAVLKGTEQVGFADMIVDPGGIVRRGILFLDDGKDVFFSLALRLALLYLSSENIAPQSDPTHPEYLRLGQTSIRPFEANDGGYVGADAGGYQFFLDFKGLPKGFKSYSLTDVLETKFDPETIKGRIVIVGVTAESVKDFFYTPFSRGHTAAQRISGAALHGHIVSQLLRFGFGSSSPLSTPNEWAELLWILFWSLTGGSVSVRIRSAWRFILIASAGLLVLGLVDYVLFLRGWWIPLIPSALTWLVSAAIVTAYMLNLEKRQRSILMQLFSKHVSSAVANTIWEQRDQFLDGGRPRSQKLIASVLFTDLVGFTSVSENLDPQSLLEWLNELFGSMSRQIDEQGGVINKYIGDAILAVFGVPVARKTKSEIGRDAVKAVKCALSMEQKIIQLNKAWQSKDMPTIGMRIGIYTGPLVAGSLGSAQRLEYTVIGDTVNTASRLESYDKGGFKPDVFNNPCRIFIGETTQQYLDNQFITQQVGMVSLKGKDQKINVYRVTGENDESPEV
jgi:adenylate cyclase